MILYRIHSRRLVHQTGYHIFFIHVWKRSGRQNYNVYWWYVRLSRMHATQRINRLIQKYSGDNSNWLIGQCACVQWWLRRAGGWLHAPRTKNDDRTPPSGEQWIERVAKKTTWSEINSPDGDTRTEVSHSSFVGATGRPETDYSKPSAICEVDCGSAPSLGWLGVEGGGRRV